MLGKNCIGVAHGLGDLGIFVSLLSNKTVYVRTRTGAKMPSQKKLAGIKEDNNVYEKLFQTH
jgi:hypothetical protein